MPLSNQQTIDLFLEASAALRNTTLGREGFSASFNIAGWDDAAETEGPDEELFRSFLMALRPFLSKSEHVHLPNVYARVRATLSDPRLQERLSESETRFTQAWDLGSIGLSFFGTEYPPAEGWRLILNSSYFHPNPHERKRWAKLTRSQRLLLREQLYGLAHRATAEVYELTNVILLSRETPSQPR
jgi:hypothetical protein